MARIIKFQGRTISVPDNATDDQIRQVLQTPPPKAGGDRPGVEPSLFDRIVGAASHAVEGVAPRQADAPTQPATEPSLVDRIMGGLDYAGNTGAIALDRLGEGAANIVGLPVDAINATPMLANLIPGVDGVGPFSEHPVGGSEWFNGARKGFGIVPDAPKPQDAFQTVAGRIGEEVGAASVPGMGILAKAGRMGVNAVREASPIAKMFLEQAAVNPAKFVAAETAGATAAGLGAGLANTVTDRHTTGGQVADLLGALGGATVAGVSGVLGRGLGNVFNALRQNPNYIDQTVKNVVVDRLGKATGLPGSETHGGVFNTDPLVEQIMNPSRGSPRPSTVVPGYQESLADATQNQGIAALEYSRQSGPNAGQFIKQRGANNDAIDAAMSGVAPTETPGVFRSALQDQRDVQLNAAAGNTQAAQDEFQQIIDGLVPSMGAEDRGAAIRAGLDNAHRSGREVERAVWEGIDGHVDPAPLADTLAQTTDGLSVARQQRISDLQPTVDIPRQLAGTPDALPAGAGPKASAEAEWARITGEPTAAGEAKPPTEVDLKEITDMRSTLLQEQRNALSGQQPDRNRAEALGRLIDDINTYLDSNAVDPALREKISNARGVSQNVNERFNRPNDPIAATLARSEGRPQVPDSAVGGKFVQPDTRQASNIDRLLAETDLTSHGRPVREAVKDEILAGIEKQRALTDPDRLDAYLNQFGHTFERFPDLREEVTAAVASGRRLSDAGAAQKTLARDIGTPDAPGRGPIGKYLQYSDAQSERAINEVLNAKDPGKAADDLLNFIGDNPKAVEGARAAMWQKLKSESQSVDNAQRSMGGGRAWRGDWLKSFMDKPATRAVLDRLYRDAPEQLEKIRAYAEVLDNVDLRQRGKAVGTSGTAQGINPVLTPETVQSRMYAWMRGQVSGTYLFSSIAAVVARRAIRNAQTDAIERLTDQVLLKPELAAALLKDNNPANRAALAKRVRLWRGNEASTFVNLMNGTDGGDRHPDDELLNTVMR